MATRYDSTAFLEAQALVDRKRAERRRRWQAAWDQLPPLGSESARAAGCVCHPGWIDGGCSVHGLDFWLRYEDKL